MVVKKYMICEGCNSYVNYYINENKSSLNVTTKCKCGKKYKCTKETKYRIKWEEVKEEENSMYKVKNFVNGKGRELQKEVKEWIESREHITILSVNMYESQDIVYCTIVYREIDYIM